MNSRALFGVGSGVAIFAFFCFIFRFLLEIPWDGAILFAIIFAMSLYFLLVFHHVSFIVQANMSWIMSNSLKREAAVYDPGFSGYRRILAQWEAPSGFHWKYPWDQKDKEINMQQVISIEGDPNEPYTFSDGATTHIKYFVRIIPLPGRLVNFHRTKEDDIKRRIKGMADEFLQRYIAARKSISWDDTAAAQLKIDFRNFLSGPNDIHPDEEAMGIWTGSPEVYDIDPPKAVQAARNFEREMESVLKIVSRMVKKSRGRISYEQALKMALVGRGSADINFVELAGLLPGGRGGRN